MSKRLNKGHLNTGHWPVAVLLLLAGCAGVVPPPGERAADTAGVGGAAEAVSGGVPGAVRARYDRALGLIRERRYREAETALRAVIRDQPRLAGPYANLGIVYAETGRVAQAERAFRQALERNPGSAASYNRLGLLYREAGRFEDARRAYEQALAADPDYAYAHLNLGILLELYLQRPASALVHYRAYERLVGGDDEVSRWIADLERRRRPDTSGAGHGRAGLEE